jgi:hypothetical protein
MKAKGKLFLSGKDLNEPAPREMRATEKKGFQAARFRISASWLIKLERR